MIEYHLQKIKIHFFEKLEHIESLEDYFLLKKELNSILNLDNELKQILDLKLLEIL